MKRVGALGSVAASLAASLIAATLAWWPTPVAAVAGFGDIDTGRYYTDAVQWSVDNNITGIDGACFSPDAAVSRGEATVYLWNMAGRPSAPAHSFVDVTGDGQNAAVSWMSHNNITTGTTETTFDPDAILTRAHLVTFLWRLADEPEAPTHHFVDVHRPWQQASVSWASHTQITTGTSATTFAPDTTLTRAHVVTFLWRYQGKPTVTVDPTTRDCNAFSAIDAGDHYSCALRTDATITCWGSNNEGQTNAPDGAFTAISAGGLHSCGLRTDATTTCWGSNKYGQTNAPDGAFTAISAGGLHSCGLRTDATITCWGSNFYGEGKTPVGTFTAISAGNWHSCALRTDATITCSGSNINDQGVRVGQSDPPDGAFTAISAGRTHSCGLKTDTTITCWGSNIHPSGHDVGQSDPPDGAFTAISAGGWHSCGLKTDTTISCWGGNEHGQSDAPDGAFTAINAGHIHSCGLRTDATITCWGNTGYALADPSIAGVIQAVYVVPSDKTPVEGQTSAIAHEIVVVQSWFDAQTGGTHPVFARDGDSISVLTVNLSGSLEELDTVGKILSEIREALPATNNQPLALFVEGQLTSADGVVTACGWTSNHVVIPIDNCNIRPLQDSVWPYGATYLLAHELAHLLGAVPDCAPNYGYNGHVVDDRRDLLYLGTEHRDWANLMLDPGNDDYYNHGRNDCADIVDSPLLGSD